jgi:hypothetical protein
LKAEIILQQNKRYMNPRVYAKHPTIEGAYYFTKEAIEHLHKKLYQYILLVTNQETQEGGTGVLAKVKERFFVVTVEHLIRKTDRKKIHIDLGLRPDDGSGIQPTIENITIMPEPDAAVLELNASEVKFGRGLGKEAFPFENEIPFSSMPQFNEFGIVGFPADNQRLSHRKYERFSCNFFGLHAMDPAKWPEPAIAAGMTDETHWLFGYSDNPDETPFLDNNGKITKRIHPGGMSGSPIWAYNGNLMFDNDAFFALVGIQTSWFEKSNCLVATKIGPVLRKMGWGQDLDTRGKK